MIKRYLKIYPSIYYTKHVKTAPEVNEHSTLLKKDYVFNQYGGQEVFLNNKLKKGQDENQVKRIYYFKLWNALTEHNFTLFENTIQQFLNEGHKYDEVIYSILVHSYVLNHKKKNENAYLVIEEMKRSYMHPAIIKFNERMINSFLELEMIFCEPSKSLWINICRLAWETSIKLNRERKRKLKEKLKLMPPQDVLTLTKEDLKLMLMKEYEDALLNMVDTMVLEDESSYDHVLIGNEEMDDSIGEIVDGGEGGVTQKAHLPQGLNHPLLAQPDERNKHTYNHEQFHFHNDSADGMYYPRDGTENFKDGFSFLYGQGTGQGEVEGTLGDGDFQSFMEVGREDPLNKDVLENANEDGTEDSFEDNEDGTEDSFEDNEDETEDSFEDNEDFDIQLLKKYYNLK
ncbi:conserved Plasmodium protein, unknown function [Plasmodium knowlesi strain H]|uniref:Uncharacterized protein n=3 Tax=Plasmodium knowlesi TaxID=5850 RepID=A0A5K1UHB7_PLAKH|nr:conserved protein, unknown function [Plasmodium knowlesi strain H]OTN67982.1 Uncharacterized protein PKNOH_S04346400 [Plasmodium knowlesi]CAA9990223.1 conserved protein, unknown function [Plasmodium knowlesi strain H]SBO26838.1 conserved Plasmodium protein, unknown function [Plasmodium knowlesi strain H]SBO28453.1 conserved Plasmodium protein, unknown function [Plasmodium knowlesi strain H]VVS79697.1 conserved protein, unknown function [Plasmodium knowlesi strain H]|eukprot:XP_002258078.1 hypothetical protein, conserved in Plasmodium species [Plasmodium knowlesi strain H]